MPVLNRFHRSRTVSGASRLSIGSVDRADEDEDEDEDGEGEGEGGGDAWSALKWGGFGRFSTWGFGAAGASGGSAAGQQGGGAGGDFPSHTDFARNFAEEAVDSSSSASSEPEEYCSEYDEDGDDGEGGEEEEPLYPGLYRALYAFDPEGTAEMRLEEDQLVRVVGRGGGVGWAVVVRHPLPPEEGKGEGLGREGHALVPESYLEAVKLDDDDDGVEGADT